MPSSRGSSQLRNQPTSHVSPRALSDPGIDPTSQVSPAWQAGSLPTEPLDPLLGNLSLACSSDLAGE